MPVFKCRIFLKAHLGSKSSSGSHRGMSSHQGELEVPAGGGEIGGGICRNLVIHPQGPSGHWGKIRSMHSNCWCYWAPSAVSWDPRALSERSCPSSPAPALDFLNSIAIKCPGSKVGRDCLHYVVYSHSKNTNLQVTMWSQV